MLSLPNASFRAVQNEAFLCAFTISRQVFLYFCSMNTLEKCMKSSKNTLEKCMKCSKNTLEKCIKYGKNTLEKCINEFIYTK